MKMEERQREGRRVRVNLGVYLLRESEKLSRVV